MLSLFNPFILKRIWDNYDSELCNNILQRRYKKYTYDGFVMNSVNNYRNYYSIYLDTIRLFSRQYFNSANKRLLKYLTTVGLMTSDIDNIFADQEQSDLLGSIDLTWLEFLFDRGVIRWCFPKDLLMINGFNSVNFDLFSALIDGIINNCHSKEYEELRNYRGGNLINTDTFHRFLDFFQTKENVEKFNCISLDSLHFLMRYAAIPVNYCSKSTENYIEQHNYHDKRESIIIWFKFQDTLCIIKNFFDNLTKEKIENLNKLSSANPVLLKLFHDKGIIGAEALLSISQNETRSNNLNSIDVDLISTLIDGVIDKLNLREAEKLANENLNYGYNPVLRDLSEVFTIFDIKENAEKFNSMNPKSLNVLIDLAIREAIKMGSSYGSYEENDMNMFYTTKSNVSNTIKRIDEFFNRTTQEQIEKFNNIEHGLLKVWIDKEIVNGSSDLIQLLDTISRMNLDLDSFTVFIDKGIVTNIAGMWLFKTKEDFNRLSSLDLDLFKNLYDNKILDSSRTLHKDGLGSLFGTREEFEELRKILDLEIFKTLFYEGVIKQKRDVDLLFGTKLDNSFRFWLNNQRNNFESRQLMMEFRRLENNILRIEQGLEEIHQNILDIPLELRERPEGFETINCDLLKILFNKNIILRNVQSIKLFFSSQEKIERFNSIGLDPLQILIDKKFIESSENLDELLNNINFVTSAINNPFLTKTILNNDSLINALGTNGIIELISHPQYARSSNYLLKNCQLALALLSKGAIENITVDYLFDSTQIQSDVTEFLKDVELADAGDNITLSMDEVIDSVFDVVNDNPMPTLGNLSLTAFAKALPSVGTRRT